MSVASISSIGKESVLHIKPFRGVNVDWKIEDFSKLPQRRDIYLNSPLYTLQNVQCFMRFFPFWDLSGNLFLIKKDSSSECNITYTFGYKSKDGLVWSSVSGCKLFPKGVNSVSHYLALPDFYEQGLTLFLIAHFLDGDAVTLDAATPSSDDVETLSHKFTKLFLSGIASDVTFKVEDQEFKVHKSVLASWSPVFKAMFETDMVEKKNGIINIVDAHPGDFHDFLLFFYSGNLDVVSAKNCMGLYALAEKYLITELKETCYECIVAEISVHSVCHIFHWAQLHHNKQLSKIAVDFYIKNYSLILLTPQWQAFMVEHPVFAHRLINRERQYQSQQID